MSLDAARLDAIRERLDKATPGPWETVGATLVAHFGENGATVAAASEPRPDGTHTVGFCAPSINSRDFPEAWANAALIANAPTDLADLLAAHDALTAQVAAARRLLFGEYPDWAMSGGDEECEHGIHTAIPCRACDMDRLGEASA